MELLQNAFSSLADTVLEELDELGAEKIKMQREQQQLVASVKAMQDQLQVSSNELTGTAAGLEFSRLKPYTLDASQHLACSIETPCMKVAPLPTLEFEPEVKCR
jgi:hypothetical protein